MKERPILFRAEMVRAILEGSKTQTRRIVKTQPNPAADYIFSASKLMKSFPEQHRDKTYVWQYTEKVTGRDCYLIPPYGQPFDRLWVRETWRVGSAEEKYGAIEEIAYKADGSRMRISEDSDPLEATDRAYEQWMPSIHMPRWASRITLEIVSVKVERLNDISRKDAKAEGISLRPDELYPEINTGNKLKRQFELLWKSINGPGSWEKNPWVWVIEFKRVKP